MAEELKETQKEMDEAALRARAELELNLDLWSAHALAQWWNRWYLKAGHRRLGRILVEIANRPVQK